MGADGELLSLSRISQGLQGHDYAGAHLTSPAESELAQPIHYRLGSNECKPEAGAGTGAGLARTSVRSGR